jgi:pterin-4a-carbinolamine dehydratase
MKAPDLKNPRRFKMTTSEVTEDGNAGPQDGELNVRRPPRRDFGEDKPLSVRLRLKAERVQLVQSRLKAMPGWELVNDKAAIQRVKEFPGPRVTTAYAAYVTEFAAASKMPVSVLLSGNRAVVTLRGIGLNRSREATVALLDFAAALG